MKTEAESEEAAEAAEAEAEEAAEAAEAEAAYAPWEILCPRLTHRWPSKAFCAMAEARGLMHHGKSFVGNVLSEALCTREEPLSQAYALLAVRGIMHHGRSPRPYAPWEILRLLSEALCATRNPLSQAYAVLAVRGLIHHGRSPRPYAPWEILRWKSPVRGLMHHGKSFVPSLRIAGRPRPSAPWPGNFLTF